MNIFAWLGLIGVLAFALLPLMKEENRSREKIRMAIVTTVIVFGIIVAAAFFNVNFLLAFLGGVILLTLFDKKTYTKKRLLLYGVSILVIGIAGYAILRDNPDYVLNHLKEHPETSSLYLAHNGEERIAYQSDIVRPLASTVKILIAVEYAMQVDEGILDDTERIPLDELENHYFEGTDGNAHEAWLAAMNEEERVDGNSVTLQDVAQGMITYSSNANTDYLIDLLGVQSINERAGSLELSSHEDVYPLVSALLIPDYIDDGELEEAELIEELRQMPMAEYRELAEDLSRQMKEGTINVRDSDFSMSLDLQRVWSDRLIGASANDYGRLLAILSNDELPSSAAETARELLEWPMEVNEGNRERFARLGAKGGSTAFILNDALYAEMLDGEKMELVFLTNDLNRLQSIMLNLNLNSFESNIIGSEDYRNKVQQELSGPQ